MAASCPVLAVTEGDAGLTIYTKGVHHRINATQAEAIDSTGAGDIFAAAFFVRLHHGDVPLEAARFASQLAARSVGREGLAGVPSQDEIYDSMAEAL
jgi:sugar/nucleoside kinase (ribokinase family)